MLLRYFHTASLKRESVGYCDTVKLPNPTKFGVLWENKALTEHTQGEAEFVHTACIDCDAAVTLVRAGMNLVE